MISVDKYAYLSKLKNREPLQKMTFALLTLAVCLWADCSLISVAVIAVMGGMAVLKSGTPLRFFVKLLFIPMAFLIVGVLTIAVNASKERETFFAAIPFADLWVGFSRKGVQDALRLFLKALASVSCLYFLSLTTPMSDLFSALRRLRVPKLLVEMMELIYRFIFVLLETADAIYHAQSCRLGYYSLTSAFRSLGTMGSMLFIRSYKRSDQLYTALESRGYEEELNMLEESYENHWSGYALAIAVNIVLVLSAAAVKNAAGGPA